MVKSIFCMREVYLCFYYSKIRFLFQNARKERNYMIRMKFRIWKKWKFRIWEGERGWERERAREREDEGGRGRGWERERARHSIERKKDIQYADERWHNGENLHLLSIGDSFFLWKITTSFYHYLYLYWDPILCHPVLCYPIPCDPILFLRNPIRY